jgi:hypothetical protein
MKKFFCKPNFKIFSYKKVAISEKISYGNDIIDKNSVSVRQNPVYQTLIWHKRGSIGKMDFLNS